MALGPASASPGAVAQSSLSLLVTALWRRLHRRLELREGVYLQLRLELCEAQAWGWHGPFMQGFALWGRHLWPWLWGTYTGDDGDKMAFREVILDPLEVLLISPSAPMERESMLHSTMKNNCSRVLTKAIWNHILPFQTVHYFIFRSCFQRAHRGLLNDYSVESTSEPILFPWGPHLSQLPVPENSTESLPLFSLCHLDSARGTFSLRSCVL